MAGADVKRRMQSIAETRKITGAMETVSVAKMRKALTRFASNKAYFSAVRAVMADAVAAGKRTEHKAFVSVPEKNVAWIAVASDKGLAGSYNHNVLAFAEQQMRDCPAPHVFAVGDTAKEYFSARGIAVEGVFADASFEPTVEKAAQISQTVYDLLESGAIDTAYIVYTATEGQGKTHPQKLCLLPIAETQDDKNADGMNREAEFEPSPEEVLRHLIPLYLTGVIYGALLESSACEHQERRNAMNSATRNAGEILRKLQTEYNRARQEAITSELTDIVTAANGVKNDDGK